MAEAILEYFDLPANKRLSDPDRIVLGPPRRSFASSNARASGKSQEGSEEISRDRTSFHERSRNGDGADSRHHERRSTQPNGRYGNRQDSEDPETEGRREYERRPKWAGRDRQDQDLEDEQAVEDSSRPGFRRDTHSKAKLSQSWFRKDAGDDDDSRRDPEKAPDWRRDRGRDRDWDRSAKVEADPEWMDSAEPEDPFQVHTQEDFQRWKERMKAGGATPLEKVESAITSPPAEEKPIKKAASEEPDDSMDKFFARFESKGTEQKPGATKAHGKTRFASLFSPATEPNKQVEIPPPMPAVDRPSSAEASGSATDADQAGFARILEMLQTRSANPTSQTQDAAKPRTPLYARGSESKAESEKAGNTLESILPMLAKPVPQHESEPRQLPTPLDRLPDSRSPTEQSTHTRQQSSINKDEGLLSLLRQASLAPKPQPPPPHQQSDMRGGGMFGVPPDPNGRIGTSRGQMIAPIQGQDVMMMPRRETGRSIFDESPISMYPNEQGPREQTVRRTTNGTQPGMAENDLVALLRGHIPQQRQVQPPQPPQGLPPGLQRLPPGLDSMPRPNPSWPPQQPQPQHHPPRQPSLPPGLSNLPRGMPVAPYGQLQQLPNPQSLQQQPQSQPQRPPPQRKYTAEPATTPGGMPNLAPGMYPPPGFMNAGPPPGFPGAMGNQPGRYGADPGPQQRAFMEMYGEVSGRGVGLRGGTGNGGVPPYR